MTIDIIGVGYACQDYLVRLPRLPGWEDRVLVAESGRQGGGVVGTAIYAAARLGARVGLVDRVGDDETGAFIRADFARAGVDLSHFELEAGATSPLSIVLVDAETGRRSFIINRGTARPFAEAELRPDYFAGARWVHLDGIQPAAALGAARLARRLGIGVSLDGSDVVGEVAPAMRDLTGLADLLIAAESFAASLTGEREPAAMARALLGFGPRIAVVTLAERGSILATRDTLIQQPGFAVDCVDTTGAGDVYHGAFLHALVQNWSLEQAQEFACLVAALKCTRLGGRAAIPTTAEIVAHPSAPTWLRQVTVSRAP